MTTYERMEKVIRYVEARRGEQPRLESLAEVAGLSVSHFLRTFSKWAGATPKDFLKFLTNEHAKALLRGSRDLLTVSLESGLSGPGRLHDLLVTVEGMTPGEYKKGGAGVEVRYGFAPSPFGTCLLARTRRGVCHLSFVARAGERTSALRALRARFPRASFTRDATGAGRLARRVFGRRGGKPVPVVLAGTPFQIKVWEA